MSDIQVLLVGIIMIGIGVYGWIKSPSVCRQLAIKQSKEEQYLVATVIKSYGIVSKKEKSSSSNNPYNYNTNYYNNLHCSYYDENKGYECNIDIERRCFPTNLIELKENDKIMICKNKNGLITYLFDGESTKQDVIDKTIKGQLIIARIFILICLFIGLCFSLNFIFSCVWKLL